MKLLRRHWFWPLLVAAFLAAQLWAHRDLVGRAAPAFHGATLDGRTFDLSAVRGKPAMVYFWGSWCPVCGAMQSSIQSIAVDHVVMTVAMQSGNGDAVARYQHEHDFYPPTMLDEDGLLAQAFGVRGVPAAFFLGPDGVIRYVAVGYTTELGLRLRLWLAGL